MSLLTTILAASVFFILAIALVGVSYLVTGKARIRGGSCSRLPKGLRGKECDNDEASCGICGKEGKEKDNDDL